MPKVKKKVPGKEEKEQEGLQEVEKEEEKEIKKEIKKEIRKRGVKEFGKKVKSGEIKEIDYILDNGYNILESEIIDVLIPGITVDLLLVGQSKGKFGGGARRIFRQTQKKTREGNKPKFSTVAVAGN